MANPISAYMDWRDNQMFKAGGEPTITRAMLRGLGVGTVDGLIGIGVTAVIIVAAGGIARLIEKIKG